MIALLLLSCLGATGIYYLGPYGIIQPLRVNEPITPSDLQLESETIEVITADSIQLRGYWIKSMGEVSSGIIILLHGISSCKEHLLRLSRELAIMGIETIVLDGRAHGESGGQFNTYGFKEKYDIVHIVDRIKTQQPDLPIGIWGHSLGGAIAIQALATDPRIEFGIVTSTFTDLETIVYDYQQRITLGLGTEGLSNFLLQRASKIASFPPAKVKPIESVKEVEQPMLIAHGDSDRKISVEYGTALFQHLKSQDKELIIVQGAGHDNLFDKGGEEYKEKLFEFVNRNIK